MDNLNLGKPAASVNPTPTPQHRRNEVNYRVMCPGCRNPTPNLHEDFSNGDLICVDCGIVVGEHLIDTRSEWRTFSNDNAGGDDPSRVGGPTNPLLDNDQQLDTMISSRDNFTGMSKELSRAQGRVVGKAADKALMNAFRTISTYCERIGLTRVITERAKQLFKIAEDEKLTRGKNAEAFIAACIYYACRQENVTRTYKEISSLTLVPKKEIGRVYKLLEPAFAKYGGSSGPKSSTEDFVLRYCSHLNLGPDVQKIAISILKRDTELGITAGKSPTSVSAAVIYMASYLVPNSAKHARDISAVSGVSESTIKSTYKDLHVRRRELISSDIVPVEVIDNLPPQ